MTLVCVSRGTFGGGAAVAEALAGKLGWPSVSREQLTDGASRAGIRVGKLEMAVVKRRRLTEELAAERDRLSAFVIADLAERLQTGGVVYHGRTGQVLLPGVTHVFRVRVITDEADRLARATARLGISREKARRYIQEVDEDRRRWVRTLRGLDWDDPHNYDAVVNLSRLSVGNVATSLVSMLQLPEFKPTPASQKLLADLWLAARCRLALGDHAATRSSNVTIRADGDEVTVTYLPRDRTAAQHIPAVLEQIEGVGSVRSTMASTTVLWVQERFDPASKALDQLVAVAERWGAAIELARFVSESDVEAPAPNGAKADVASAEGAGQAEADGASRKAEPSHRGGVIPDESEPEPSDDGGVGATMDKLVQAGRAGGAWRVCGDAQSLVAGIGTTKPYALAVVGEVHLDKGAAVRKRYRRDLVAQLGESMHVPVVGVEELEAQLMFGPKQWLRLLASAAITAFVLWAVFTHQVPLANFLLAPGVAHRLLVAGCIGVFVPVFAFVYGTFAQYLLRLLKFE